MSDMHQNKNEKEVTHPLVAAYNEAVNNALNEFLKKHDSELEFWLGDKIGGICYIADYSFDFIYVIQDLELDAPKSCIWDYLEHLASGINSFMSYPQWVAKYKEKQ